MEYRVWDTRRNKIHYNNYQKVFGDKVLFQLYTGFKDIILKKIYDGDIGSLKGIAVEVVFEEGCFQLRMLDGGGTYPMFEFDIGREFEVTGNVSERRTK